MRTVSPTRRGPERGRSVSDDSAVGERMADVPDAPGIPHARYDERIERTQALLAERRATLLLGPGPDLRWLTGYATFDTERLTMLAVPPRGRVTLLVPRLEREGAREAPAVMARLVDLETWEETEDPIESVRDGVGSTHGRFLVADRLRASFLLQLQRALGGGEWGVASEVTRQLRAVKDADEIRLLAAAAQGADNVMVAVARGRLVGRSEADVAREIKARLADEGHDGETFAIVGSGPNSASPHHEPGERVIGAGEALVLDIGGEFQGYWSDTTRTFWVAGDTGAEPEPEFVSLYEVLEGAQEAATLAVQPGIECDAIDEVARSAISAAGYGDLFIHRTGHGIGLEDHEHPYLVNGNSEPLREGNAFSVEPGIYLEGRYGARIEDICVCTRTGAEVLNRVPRELAVVSGT